MQNVLDYIEPYISVDEPVPYKNLLLYPFKVKDYYIFSTIKDVLLIDKNKIPDIKIIQMTYLEYLSTVLFVTDEVINDYGDKLGDIYNKYFFILMSKTFNVDSSDIKIGAKPNGSSFSWVIRIKDTELTAQEFDDIKQLILYMNIYKYDDTVLSPEVEEMFQNYYELKSKGYVAPNLSEKISNVMIGSSLSKNEILDMSIIEFEITNDMILDKTNYMINLVAQSNGATFDKPIEHWLIKTKKNKYSDMFVDMDEYINNINK